MSTFHRHSSVAILTPRVRRAIVELLLHSVGCTVLNLQVCVIYGDGIAVLTPRVRRASLGLLLHCCGCTVLICRCAFSFGQDLRWPSATLKLFGYILSVIFSNEAW